MDELVRDVRYALRSLLRRPSFAITALAILALGIGINTAMFSVVRGVLLEPLPYVSSERLVRMHHVHEEGGVADGLSSPLDFEDLVEATTSFSRLAAFWHAPGLSNVTLTGSSEAALRETAFVSDAFLATLGVPALLGRWPAPDEMVEGADRALLGESAIEIVGVVGAGHRGCRRGCHSHGHRPVGTLVGAGLLFPIVAATGVTRLLRGLVHGVSTTDPTTFAVVAALLTTTALAASALPALWASRVEPTRAFRAD